MRKLLRSLGLGVILCFLVLPAYGQIGSEGANQPEIDWQPPTLANLPIDWWDKFDDPSQQVLGQRMGLFTADAQKAVLGLDGADLVAAQNLLQSIGGEFDLLLAARQAPEPEQFQPVATRDAYALEELLELRGQWRDLQKSQKLPRLRLEELESQSALLERRRDALLPQYTAADENSPSRLLLGLQRVSTRLEYELTIAQSRGLETRLAATQAQYEIVEQHLRFALEHLALNEVDWSALDARLTEAHGRVTELSEKLSDVQRQLLAVVTTSGVKPSLEILRKQQLTRSSAELALAQLQELKLVAFSTWLRLRSGTLEFDFDIQQAMEQRQAFIKETARQVEVWSTASQTTILSPAPVADLNSVKNIELAHAAAQDTLALIDEINDVSDDLGLLHQVLTAAQVNMQQGLKSIWTRFRVMFEEARYLASAYLDVTLFHVGDAPVTTGSIIKMLVILALGLLLSWFIRHLLERLKDRRQFAKSPVVYTLGRLLHYIIILVAVFAAFGSIGLDFRNFALIAGALSVGIGFGLQSIVNNFVSGLILLFEGSLRVGDYVELDTGLRGIVKEINTRATVINTNDSIDVVVPNSNFVTSVLTNWTLREPLARFRIEFGVAYGSDKEVVKAAALEAAAKVEFVVQHMPGRGPEVWLTNFGDSALVFQLLVWVSKAGVRRPERVRCAILWELETQLTEHGITIPFPQRDLHLRSGFVTEPAK
jgi:small-conductance mechanosensitive channel